MSHNQQVTLVVEDQPAAAAFAETFLYFWAAFVVLFMVVGVAWGINDIRRGSARLSLIGFGARVSREEEPFEFWIAVGSKLLVLPVGAFMLWMAFNVMPG